MSNKKKVILDLCGGTGAWSKPYKDAGYTVINCTLPQCDVREFHYTGDVYGILVAPPCTHFSLARTTASTPRDYERAMQIVRACMSIIQHYQAKGTLKFWAMENPTGLLRKFIGRPWLVFDPSEFGDDYNKSTDLWGYFNAPVKKFNYKRFPSTDKNTRKLPVIPSDYVIDTTMSRVAIRRSITSEKFAKAFYSANR